MGFKAFNRSVGIPGKVNSLEGALESLLPIFGIGGRVPNWFLKGEVGWDKRVGEGWCV